MEIEINDIHDPKNFNFHLRAETESERLLLQLLQTKTINWGQVNESLINEYGVAEIVFEDQK